MFYEQKLNVIFNTFFVGSIRKWQRMWNEMRKKLTKNITDFFWEKNNKWRFRKIIVCFIIWGFSNLFRGFTDNPKYSEGQKRLETNGIFFSSLNNALRSIKAISWTEKSTVEKTK